MDSNHYNPASFAGAPSGNQANPSLANFTPTSGAFVPPSFQGSMFTEDGVLYGSADGQDYLDPKRRRIARACDMCRKKKIKCDGKLPACSHCENYNTECVFTHVEKKRSPPKGAKYIEGLENRLGRMESLLRLSGLLGDDEEETDLGTLEQKLAQKSSSNNGSPTNTSELDDSRQSSHHQDETPITPRHSSLPTPNSNVGTSPRTSKLKGQVKTEEKGDLADLSDMMSCLVTNSHGETRYIGSSSGFSIFSPKGIEWVNSKTGDSTFQDMIAKVSIDDNKWHPWRPEIFGDIFARRVFKALPSRDECFSLLGDFFQSFNMMFPLFHEPTFMHLVDKQYSDDPYDGSGWWASLNVALAIGYRIRIMNNQIPKREESVGWGYFKNALAVFSELTLRNADLLSVQALLGMSLFLQGTPNPQPSFFLVAAAVRLAHSLGLHKRGSAFGLNEVEAEQRKRVFWIAYLLDKDISLRSGRPPMQDDDDWNVELPAEDAPDNVGNIPLADGKGKTNLFRLLCRFAIIASKVYNQLYSVKASKQSDGELLNTIGDLDNELEAWKDSIPLDFRPEHEINASHSPLIFQVVVLHFAYYNCLTTIHRMSIHHGYWSDKLSEYAIQGLNVKPLNPRVFSSAALCVAAARASINLIRYIPPGDYSCIWLILYYPVSALITIFANILQNPNDTRARSDLKLMEEVVNFLSRIYHEESTGSMKRMFTVCNEFKRITGVVLDKAEQDMNSRQRRKHEREREKVEKASDQHRQTKQQSKQRDDHNQVAAQSSSQNGTVHKMTGQFDASAMSDSNSDTNAIPRNVFGISGQQSSPESRPNQQFSGLNNDTGIEWIQGLQQDATGTSGPNYSQGGGMQSDLNFNFDPLSMAENFASNNLPAFQQPFLPQDLWSMPMTFEWDWADMTMPVFPDIGQRQEDQHQPR